MRIQVFVSELMSADNELNRVKTSGGPRAGMTHQAVCLTPIPDRSTMGSFFLEKKFGTSAEDAVSKVVESVTKILGKYAKEKAGEVREIDV